MGEYIHELGNMCSDRGIYGVTRCRNMLCEIFLLNSRVMGLFNFFGESEHKVFDYKPIYYNREEDERKRRFGSVDGTLDKEKAEGKYVPGSYIKGSMRDGGYQKTRSHMSKVHTVVGIISMILIFMVLYFIAKFYSML